MRQKNKMTFFEGLLAIIGTILFIGLVINIGFAVMSSNERFQEVPFVLKIIVALVIGGVIVYFILKAAKSCHQDQNLDFIISGLSCI